MESFSKFVRNEKQNEWTDDKIEKEIKKDGEHA